jgi:hypothetical protein
VNAVAGDDEVGGRGGAVFEREGYFIGAGVLGEKLALNSYNVRVIIL